LSSLFSFHSGQPFNFDAGTQRPGLNIIGNPFAGVSHTSSRSWRAVGESRNDVLRARSGGLRRTHQSGWRSLPEPVRGPGFADVDLSVIKNISFGELEAAASRRDVQRVQPQEPGERRRVGGSNGFLYDTIGDFNGAPGLGPGEPFNMQLVGKIIF
jgi:hypothetical protein